jgi:hypothetical protein
MAAFVFHGPDPHAGWLPHYTSDDLFMTLAKQAHIEEASKLIVLAELQ